MSHSYSESVLYYNLPMNGSVRYPVFNIKKRRRFWWISQVAAFEIQQAWRLFEQRIRSRKGSRGRSPFLGRVSAMKYTATKYCSELNLFLWLFAMNLNHGVQSYKLGGPTRSPIEGLTMVCHRSEGVWIKVAGRNKSSWSTMQRCLQRHFPAFLLFHVLLTVSTI